MGMENKNVPEWMLRDKHISESRLLQGLRIDSLRLAHPAQDEAMRTAKSQDLRRNSRIHGR